MCFTTQKCQKNSGYAVKKHSQNHFGHHEMTAYPESALSETALAEGWLYLNFHKFRFQGGVTYPKLEATGGWVEASSIVVWRLFLKAVTVASVPFPLISTLIVQASDICSTSRILKPDLVRHLKKKENHCLHLLNNLINSSRAKKQ